MSNFMEELNKAMNKGLGADEEKKRCAECDAFIDEGIMLQPVDEKGRGIESSNYYSIFSVLVRA